MRLLKSTKCESCGTEITGAHVKPGFIDVKQTMGENFYGNRVQHLIKAVCPCGTEYLACLIPDGNSFKVIDLISEKDAAEVQETKQEEETETLDIDTMKRPELLKLAVEVGVEGKTAIMKTDELREKIKEKVAVKE